MINKAERQKQKAKSQKNLKATTSRGFFWIILVISGVHEKCKNRALFALSQKCND